MRLKLIKICNILFLLITSCTQKDKFENYKLYVRNNTSQEINIITFKNNNETNNITISTNERGLACFYEENVFSGYNYSICNIDSLKIVFPNNKGYLCDASITNSFCFGNDITPWSYNEKFINTTGDTYEFTITEEDFENALDLP